MFMFRIIAILTFLLAIPIWPQGGLCLAAPDSLPQQTAYDFTAAAQQAISAVVSIKVKKIEKSSPDESDKQEELFKDDFFHRLFSSSKEKGKKEPEKLITLQALGFIISPDGYILTSHHVVNEASEILVILSNGREYPGKVVGQDSNTDIALVKIDGKNLPYLKLGN